MGLFSPGYRFARLLFVPALLLLALVAHGQVAAPDADDLVVRNIRVEGLQRIAEGTVFNHLPVNIGVRIDHRCADCACRIPFGNEFHPARARP